MLSFPDLRLDRGRIRRTGRRAFPFSVGESIALVCLVLVVIASILGPIVSPYSPIIPSGAQL
ncbi:MAG: hypothetical protein JWM70_1950, partial [Microbacteriaceae bacterium]|nr:hypothetical protein [Microbacteriaceae bacterium]